MGTKFSSRAGTTERFPGGVVRKCLYDEYTCMYTFNYVLEYQGVKYGWSCSCWSDPDSWEMDDINMDAFRHFRQVIMELPDDT